MMANEYTGTEVHTMRPPDDDDQQPRSAPRRPGRPPKNSAKVRRNVWLTPELAADLDMVAAEINRRRTLARQKGRTSAAELHEEALRDWLARVKERLGIR
jgi:hypothetical protein